MNRTYQGLNAYLNDMSYGHICDLVFAYSLIWQMNMGGSDGTEGFGTEWLPER